MSEPNFLLESLIDDAGLSHAGLAARINRLGERERLGLQYDHASVARWIRDHAVPRGRVPDLICEIIGARLGRTLTLADIGMDQAHSPVMATSLTTSVDRAVALWRRDIKRPDALSGAQPVEGADAIAPVWEWENPPDDVDIARSGDGWIGSSDLGVLGDLRARYEEMYRRVGGMPTRPRIVGALNSYAAPLLRSGYGDEVGRRLYRSVGSLVALAGICAYDANQQALAQRYFFHALRMAKASQDRGFGGYVVALLTNQAMYLRNYRQVIQYAETALRGAGDHLSPAVVTDLHSLQAKAFARMADRQACHTHMRFSEASATRIGADEPPETGYVSAGLVECQHAEALRSLGDLAAAKTYAAEAARTAATTHIRGQVHRHAALAMVLAQDGAADEALAPAQRMLNAARGMESGRIAERVRSVCGTLSKHGKGREVADFVERANEQLRAP